MMSKTDKQPAPFTSGLQTSGEFNVGEKITFGIRDGNILLRMKPQGDEIEVSEATLAGVLVDTFFKREKLGLKT